ncbi:MAG: purine-nucleoside phosphorylase [Actinobacteria bacterium]|nr:purine-nucleoside phosphorylase [Actinomycetota bacterium]
MSHELNPRELRHAAEELAQQAATALTEHLGCGHDIAVVLGSGWAASVEAIGPITASASVSDIPGMRAPGVQGHGAQVHSVAIDEQRNVLVFLGRTHIYEGFGPQAVAHNVRAAVAHGCRTIILTNGAGAINPDFSSGQVVLVSDHINLTGQTALVGPEFIDLTDLYSARLRAMVRDIDASLAEGVYAQFHGPAYETPAEIRMARSFGADLVGMSTAVEAVAAKAAGADVLCLSLVTNMAAGVTGAPINHAEVLAAGAAATNRLGSLLSKIITRLSDGP